MLATNITWEWIEKEGSTIEHIDQAEGILSWKEHNFLVNDTINEHLVKTLSSL